MKRFRTGESYRVNGGGTITITKRTSQYVTYTGDYSGKKKIYTYDEEGLFGLGEHILVPMAAGHTFCFAGKEIKA